MGDFQTQFVIKKMATVTLNKANNFTVDLNQLGLGHWEKGKIDVFSSVKNMTLSRYCKGYSLEVVDIGTTTPIYRAQVQKVANKHSYKTFRTTGYPKLTTHVIGDSTFMFSVYIEGIYGGNADYNNSKGVWVKKNGEIMVTEKQKWIRQDGGIEYHWPTQIGSATSFKDINEKITITGGWGDSIDYTKPFKFEIREFYLDETYDTDSNIVCIFIHK